MGKRKQSSEWMPDEPGVVGHRWLPKQTGLDFKMPKRGEVIVALITIVFICIGLRMATVEPKPPSYERATETPLMLQVAGYVFVGSIILLVVAGIVTVLVRAGVSAWKTIEMARIEIEHARATETPENGFTVVTKDGKRIDTRMAPAGIVDKHGGMPVPETSDHYAMAEKVRMLDMVRAARNAGAAVELMRDPEPPAPWIEADNEKADWERQLTDGLE